MNKIATHDSATGEKGKGFLSWLVTPFARTQRKNIKEQYEAGCRSFDIRVRKDKDGIFRCAHGLWMSKKSATEILSEVNYQQTKDLLASDFKEECPFKRLGLLSSPSV